MKFPAIHVRYHLTIILTKPPEMFDPICSSIHSPMGVIPLLIQNCLHKYPNALLCCFVDMYTTVHWFPCL